MFPTPLCAMIKKPSAFESGRILPLERNTNTMSIKKRLLSAALALALGASLLTGAVTGVAAACLFRALRHTSILR